MGGLGGRKHTKYRLNRKLRPMAYEDLLTHEWCYGEEEKISLP